MQANLINTCDGFMGDPAHYSLVISDTAGETLYSTEVESNECTTANKCSVTILTTVFTTSLSIQLSLSAVNMAGTSLYLPIPQICELKILVHTCRIMFIATFFYRSNKCLVLSTSDYFLKLLSPASQLCHISKSRYQYKLHCLLLRRRFKLPAARFNNDALKQWKYRHSVTTTYQDRHTLLNLWYK